MKKEKTIAKNKSLTLFTDGSVSVFEKDGEEKPTFEYSWSKRISVRLLCIIVCTALILAAICIKCKMKKSEECGADN